MKRMRDRNQAVVGLVSVVLVALTAVFAFFSGKLPALGGGRTYSAYFTESAGLTSGNAVQAAGVKVGEVESVSLDGNRVLVEFTVDEPRLGKQTRASIQIKTLMGEKYLGVAPQGRGELDAGEPIPVARTRVPFEVPDVFDKLTSTAGKLDTGQLARSFRVMAQSLEGGSKHMDEALTGLSQLSKTISSRDDKLKELLNNAGGVSKIVADRDEQVRKLVSGGNLLLEELQRRRDAISSLLRGTQELSAQVRGLVAENRKALSPALGELNKLTTMLQRNQDKLAQSIKALAPYIRGFTNTTGSGQWYDGYLCGLLPPPINAGAIRTNPKGCEVPVPEEHIGGGR